jgi:Coenzyme PQQ synthesis protein D (PqqD)
MKRRACIYRKSPEIVSRKIVDEMILVPVQRTVGDVESLYTLNELGGRIWELIDGKRDLPEIRDVIVAEFDADEITIETDLVVFLDQLTEVGAITEVPQGGA